MDNHGKTIAAFESIASGLGRGLVYIKEDYNIGAYSNMAKEMTGIRLPSYSQGHAEGIIEEGDIIVIADNDLGNDDGLSPENLKLINIVDNNIKTGDALLAVGVYKNKKIEPAYKVAHNYDLKQTMELKRRYLGYNISAAIDEKNSVISISVNDADYRMRYLEAIGHMVVLDKNTGKVKFFQARGYGFRNEEIGKLLLGKKFIAKETSGDKCDLMPHIDRRMEEVFEGAKFIEEIKFVMQQENGYSVKNVYNIHKRPMYCHMVRLKMEGQEDGVYIFIQDKEMLQNQPASRDVMTAEIEKLKKKKFSDEEAAGIDGFKNFIGNDKSLIGVKRLSVKAAKNRFNVMLTGESGTGKSLLAKEIHDIQMPDKPFVEVCCNAISPTLFESELFGYAPGAFTGASSQGKAGYFEEASGGTIFLDEIGDISPEMQIKLLHVIQNKRIYRVGDTKPIDVDVRIITATNKDLEKEVENGNFRKDLYYRINVFPIYIPPLRERKSDLYFLANSILNQYCREYDIKPKQFSQEAIDIIMSYKWPGNVRELKNAVECAVAICDEELIYSEHLMLSKADEKDRGLTLKERLNKEERRIIEDVIERNGGDKGKAMEELDLPRSSFYKKLKMLDLNI